MSSKWNPPASPPQFNIGQTQEPYPTPPMTQRKRRQLQRSSDDTQGLLSLKEYLMRVDTYRVTIPLGNPLPSKIFPLHDGHPMLQSFPQIRDIAIKHLDLQNVQHEDIQLFGSPDGRTLRISSRMEITRNWSTTAQEIHHELHLAGHRDLAVELLNPFLAYRFRQFKIPDGPDGEMVVRNWGMVKNFIMPVIDEHFVNAGFNWNTVSVFMCGKSEDASSPTIVITADLGVLLDWSDLTLAIQIILAQHSIAGFDVEFSPGRVVPSKLLDIMSPYGNGDSMGIIGDDKFSGTLGGFIKLIEGTSSQTRLCAVTCHHVVHPEDRQPNEFRDVFHLQPAGAITARTTRMRSPSQRDFEDTIAYENSILSNIQSRIFVLETAKESQDGFLPPYQEKALEHDQGHLNAIQSRSQDFRAKETSLGITIASSGLRINDNSHKMDWALVEIPPDRFQANSPPDPAIIAALGDEHQPKDKQYNPTILSIDKTGAVKLGEWIVMKGRTSGIQTGVVHKVNMEVNDWCTGGGQLVSSETIVISTGEGHVESRPGFSTEGDSGAWTYNADGVLVGQQIAHRQRTVDFADLTIVSPIADVFRDIQEITGGSIELPVE